MALIQILSGGNISHVTSLISFAGGQAAALPFLKEPRLKRKSIDPGFENILDAHFRDNREAPNLLSVYITSDMALAFVPNIGVDVPPAVLLKNGMYCGPPDFRVPKP